MSQRLTVPLCDLHASDKPPEKGLVSVIVPVYNGERYLRESLDSILVQTYPNIEILVMDDASTDGTAPILETYESRVRIFRQPSNRGIYGNANDGIALARGEFICVYHADDIYAPTMVEREVEFLNRYPETGAVFTNMIFIGPDSRDFGLMHLPPEVVGGGPFDFPEVFNALLTRMNRFLMCPTAMVRAAVHRDVGVYRDETFRNTSDLEMWLRIAQKYPIGILEDRLLRYRHFHEKSSHRYHRLRTETGRYFTIMDLYLDRGGRAIATKDALAAHEAHRAEDLLMTAASNYILDHRWLAREMLSKVRAARILGSSQIQRGRMLTLFLLLQVLVRNPRISFLANAFRKRWHEKKAPRPKHQVYQPISRNEPVWPAGR